MTFQHEAIRNFQQNIPIFQQYFQLTKIQINVEINNRIVISVQYITKQLLINSYNSFKISGLKSH